MVICSDCGTRVPPKVLTCPKCSAPVDATGVRPRSVSRLPPWWMIAGALALLLAAGIGSYFLFGRLGR
jgi:hypothetical protein